MKTNIVLAILLLLVVIPPEWLPEFRINTIMHYLVIGTALFSIVFVLLNSNNKLKVPGEIEFSNISYFSLLFTLSMGIGILNFGFSEVYALSSYDVKSPYGLMLNHWIIIPWCIYLVFTIFEIYDQIYKILPKYLRNIKDVVYSISMILGVAISFALCVIAISNTIKGLYAVNISYITLILILGGLTGVSLLLGIHKGMKVFSNITVFLLLGFTISFLFFIDLEYFNVLFKSIKDYFVYFFDNNLPNDNKVQLDWTAFYWVWWLSWSTFVSKFLIQISKGRSIRSIIFYTLIIPSIFVTIYMTLGNYIGMNSVIPNISYENLPLMVLRKCSFYPYLFIGLMGLFFITSADSQSYSLGIILSGNDKVGTKILWLSTLILLTTYLLMIGDGTISIIQNLSFYIVPFLIILIIINTYKIIKIWITR